MSQTPLLSLRNLRTMFAGEDGEVVAVDNVSFDVNAGEIVGVVGESGSGKSVTALSIMGLLPKTGARISGGEILFRGRDLLKLSSREMRGLRGREIGMIFQEPMSSLNPVFPIGDQIAETIIAHERIGHRAASARAADLLNRVGISSPARRMLDYPHQLSGGMRQRVMIAIALACSPKLLLADEPTTALDVTIQAQLLDLLRDIQDETGMAIVLITHNMGVIAECADRVVVMYAGRVAEEAPVDRIFDAPNHPYTVGLLGSTPDITRDERRLWTIPGSLPRIEAPPSGCRFAPRCQLAIADCERGQPEAIQIGAAHWAACLRTQDASSLGRKT